MNTWIFIVVMIFNVGAFVGMYFNHIRHTAKALERLEANDANLFSIVNSNRDRISKMEGKLNSKR